MGVKMLHATRIALIQTLQAHAGGRAGNDEQSCVIARSNWILSASPPSLKPWSGSRYAIVGGEWRSATVLPIIPVSGPAPGCVQGGLVLVQRLHRDRLMAATQEAILPTIPAPKLLVTAQTRGRSGIRAAFRGSALWAFRGPLRIMTILIGWQQCEGYIAPWRVSRGVQPGLRSGGSARVG